MNDVKEYKSGLLPSSIKDSYFKALDALLSRLDEIEIEKVITTVISKVDEELLPILAEQYHITGPEGWSFLSSDDYANMVETDDETVDPKRNLIRNAINLHKRRGTKWSIKETLRILGLKGEIIEWFENREGVSTEPYTFRAEIDLKGVPFTEEVANHLVAMVNAYKNVRSQMTIGLSRSTDDKFYSGGAVSQTQVIHLFPMVRPVEISGKAYAAGVYKQTTRVRLTDE